MILYLILAAGLVSAIWHFYYKRHWHREVSARLRFAADALYAGEETKLYEMIENRKAMPVPVLEVGFHTDRALDFAQEDNTNVSDYIYKRDIFSVLGRQKITREIPVICTKRGLYAVKEAELSTYSFFYKNRFTKEIASGASIYVYPKMTDVSDIMPLCERMLGTVQCAKRLYEDPFAFRTIREYTVDDPMKTINWKAAAKTGKLMVNTFDSVLSCRAMVFLDVADEGILKYEELVEESISIAATLVRKMLRQGIEAGFCFNGTCAPKSGEQACGFAPTKEKGMLVRMERMLAAYRQENGTASYEAQLDAYPTAEDTLLVFITKNLNAALLASIKKRAGENPAVVVCPVYRGETLPELSDIKSRGNVRVVIRETGLD